MTTASDLFYTFNTNDGDHHIIPVSMAALRTRIEGKQSATYVLCGNECWETDPSTFLVCTMERALQDRSVWGNDNGHNTTSEVAYARKS